MGDRSIFPDLQKQLGRLETELLSSEATISRALDNVHKDCRKIPNSTNQNAFNANLDDEELLQNFFRDIDTDQDHVITVKEIGDYLKDEPDHLGFVESLMMVLNDVGDETKIDFKEFKSAAQKVPRVKGQRVSWAAALEIDAALAKYLKVGTFSDPLKGIKGMSDDELRAACSEFFRNDLIRMVIEGRQALFHTIKSMDAEQTNQKFSGTAGATVASFATLDDFQKGPEGLLGCPNPKLMEGMEVEHCLRPSAKRFLLTPNYEIVTRSEWEWNYSVHGGAQEVPSDLEERFLKSGSKFPGEHGDLLSELEIHLKIGKASSVKALSTTANLEQAIRKQLASSELLFDEEKRLRGISVQKIAEIEGDNEFEMTFSIPATTAADTSTKAQVEDLVRSAVGFDPSRAIDISLRGRTQQFCEYVDSHSILADVRDAPGAELERRLRTCEGVPRAEECAPPLDKPSQQEYTERLERHALALDRARAALLRAEDERAGRGAASGGLSPEADALSSFATLLREAFEEQSQLWRLCNRVRRQGRGRPPKIGEFIQRLRLKPENRERLDRSRLRLEEVLALSMYTGPLYVLYNAVLRGFPPALADLLNHGCAAPGPAVRAGAVFGNRFETTIFVICSGITKLSRFTRVPPSRLLYRGLGGMLLPEQFWREADGRDYKGGVEFGLMSTTTERSIAVQYSGTHVRRGIVFEISAGRIDIGASISFLSQYSREEEFLIQPLSFVEVPRRAQTR